MDVPAPPPDDEVLAAPVRALLFRALAELRRPARTAELAERVGRHPNTVRVQLQRLADAGLIERRVERLPRGRPRDAWAILPGARPDGLAPSAHALLSRWLTRALARGERLADVEAAGREIGRELAPATTGRDAREALGDALAALAFAPAAETTETGWRHVLANCPYRDAVTESPAVVCTLHRGITQGLLDRLAPRATLKAFVPRDPYVAGCVIEVGVPS